MSIKTKNWLLIALIILLMALATLQFVAKPLYLAAQEKKEQIKEDKQYKEFFAWRDR